MTPQAQAQVKDALLAIQKSLKPDDTTQAIISQAIWLLAEPNQFFDGRDDLIAQAGSLVVKDIPEACSEIQSMLDDTLADLF